jgi:hypothetical protein
MGIFDRWICLGRCSHIQFLRTICEHHNTDIRRIQTLNFIFPYFLDSEKCRWNTLFFPPTIYRTKTSSSWYRWTFFHAEKNMWSDFSSTVSDYYAGIFSEHPDDEYCLPCVTSEILVKIRYKIFASAINIGYYEGVTHLSPYGKQYFCREPARHQ